ncbi:MAG TPA: VOC family protein [Pyrinomonadaceae bacterium]|nr:VOC family protein [Pyrinomonadaceae bacterium]
MASSLNEQLDKLIGAVIAGTEPTAIAVGPDLTPLVQLATVLRLLPRQDFRTRVKQELQRSASAMKAMATESKVKAVREGFQTVTPYLAVPRVHELIDFVRKAFDAEGTIHGTGSEGGIHAEFKIGDSIIMMGGGSNWKGTPRPTALHYYVDDVDAVYRRALEAGATSMVEPLEDHGDRLAGVKDVAGNEWYIAKRLSGSHTDEGLRSVTPYLHPKGSLAFIGFLKQAFAAEEIAVYQSPDGIVQHAKIRIGDSVIEMGEAHGQWQPMPTMFFLYVDDVDAWYERALAGGASSIDAPADQPYGDRVASVADSFDNLWYIATHIADTV